MSSFSRAAERLGLSQASVSERIATLESAVGSLLLERGRGRAVAPTPLGQTLFDLAARLLDDRERAVQEIRAMLGGNRGSLSIGTSTVPGTYFLPAAMRGFRALYPGARFSVTIAASEAVIDGVAAGDFGLGIAGDAGERLVSQLLKGSRKRLGAVQPLWHDELVPIVPAGHPLVQRVSVEVDELLSFPFVMREPGSGTRRWLECYFREQRPDCMQSLDIAAEVGSLCALKQAVVHGVGVSVVSRIAVQAEIDAGLLHRVPFAGPRLTRNFYLLRDEERTPSPLGRLFERFLLESVGQAVAANGSHRAAPGLMARQR